MSAISGSCSICKKIGVKLSVSCEYCHSFWSCSKKCGKSIFVKDHMKDCAKRIEYIASNDCGDENESDDFELVYTVDQNVVCQTGSSWQTWKPAVVTQTKRTTYSQSGYYCRLTHNDRSVFKLLSEENDHIRPHNFDLGNHLDVLVHHLSWNASFDVLQDIIDTYRMDINIIGQKLLFACARYDLQDAFEWLVSSKGVDCNSKDESGRNVLIYALAEKQMAFVQFLIGFDKELLTAEDKRKWNLLHHLVVANDEKLLQYFVATDGSPIHDTLITASAIVWNEQQPAAGDSSAEEGKTQRRGTWFVMSEWKDAQGRSARDIAVALKRTNLVALLDSFTIQAKLHSALLTISMNMCDKDQKSDKLKPLIEFVAEHKVDLRSLPLLRTNEWRLRMIVFDLATAHIFEEGLLWLYDNWRHDIAELGVKVSKRFPHNSIVQHFLYGPSEIHFSPSDLDPYVTLSDDGREADATSRDGQTRSIVTKLRIGFYDFLSGWDGVVDIPQYASTQESKKMKDPDSFLTFSNHRHDYKNVSTVYRLGLPKCSYGGYNEHARLLFAHIDQYIACQQLPQLYSNRLAIFQWMLRTLNQPLPPLHLFVEFGQLHLLQWACTEGGLVHLTDNVASNTALRAHCESLHILNSSDLLQLSIAECLCLVAVTVDQLSIFQWLFNEHLPNKSLTVGAEGLNLLQLGASLGSYTVVKWLVANKLLDPAQQSGSGLNSLHLAISKGHVAISLYLLTVVPAELQDAHGNDALYFIDNSKAQRDNRLHIWVDHRRRTQLFMDFYRDVKDGNFPFSSWLEHLEALNFMENLCDSFYFHADTFGFHFSLFEEYEQRLDQCPHFDNTFSFEECVLLLAAGAQCLEFFQYLRERLDTWIKEQHGFSGDKHVSCVKLTEVLSSWATERNKPEVADFMAGWRADLTRDDDVDQQLRSESMRFQKLFLDGASVEEVEQCVQVQKDLLAKLPSQRKGFALFTCFHKNFRIGPKGMEQKDKCTYVEHVLNEKHFHLLRWMLEFVAPTLSFLSSVLTHAIKVDSMEVVKLVMTRLNSAELIVDNETDSDSGDACIVESNPVGTAVAKAMSACCSYDTKTGVRIDIFKYLFGFIEGKGVEGASYCFYTCVLALLNHDCEDNWTLVRFMLSRPDEFPTNIAFSYDYSTKKRQDAVLVADLLTNITSRWGSDEDDAKNDNLANELREQGAHIIRIVEVLYAHQWHVSQHEAKIMTSFQRVDKESIQAPAVVDLIRYFAETFGFDIRTCTFSTRQYGTLSDHDRSVLASLEKIKSEQAERWKLSDLLSKGATNKVLMELVHCENEQQHFTSAKQAKGRSLLHIAALHNRVDVMRWLVADYHMDVLAVDSAGDSVLLLAQKAGATDAELFVVRLLASRKVAAFSARHFYHRRFLKYKRRANAAVIAIQSKYRQIRVWRQYGPFLQTQLQSLEWFRGIWGQAIALLDASKLSSGESLGQSWASIKLQHDMLAVDGSVEGKEVESVMANVLSSSEEAENEGVDNDDVFSQAAGDGTGPSILKTSSVNKPLDTVDLSQSALKWLESADQRYKAMFQSRVAQLAEGDRSYALSKRLKGCEYAVYETKLDAGQRILWTQFRRGSSTSVLVWFVSKHDNVSRLVKQIDNSYARLSRQPDVNVAAAKESVELRDEDILLDPIGNCPLKIYTASRGDIPLLTTTGWTPPLRLGNKQQEIQDVSGTVLLLGRSGTGKTVCLSDRMTRDRECMRVTQGVACNQLFVSRSKKLCEFVRAYQTKSCTSPSDLDHTDFVTLDQFVARMEKSVASNGSESSVLKVYMSSRRVDFQRFRLLMAAAVKKSKLEAVVVWTQIRSFIKGSVEAVLQGSPLTLDQYLSEAVMGQDRCRLLPEQRRRAFAVYSEYTEVLGKEGLWDDADRVLDALTSSKLQPLSACNGKGADYHKVYVDEVQDNTQAEIVLYFLAAGLNTQSLFLAGDPAQSVVEGVDFRFEEVRSIVYKLSGGKESISRPIKLTTNYRSHSGIMDCAAAILDKMFRMFPGAASILPRDAGLFKGPRPAYCSVFAEGSLVSLLRQSERIVVICPDDKVQRVEELLSESDLVNSVWGIRAAKGLEFQDIVLFDFFSSVPATDHKAWRSLLAEEQADCRLQSFPQIESQLKLLYTAITRSCNRLLFVESINNSLCSMFFRWLSARSLAEPFAPSVGGEVKEFMTSDEWRARGIELAVSAEGSDAVLFLQRAVRCFQLAGDSSLRTRASVHLEMEVFRSKFMSAATGTGETMRPKDELDLAALVSRAIRASLLGEARDLCELVREAVSEPKYFAMYVLMQL